MQPGEMEVNRMDKKTYLCRYHNLMRRIEHLEKDIERCRQLASSIPGPNYDRPVVDGTRNLEAPFVKWIYREFEYEEELKKLRPEAENVKTETLDAISGIGDTELESVLIYRYIYWNSWNEIADKVYASSTQARRLHDRALELFEVPK